MIDRPPEPIIENAAAPNERRLFSRVAFDARAELTTPGARLAVQVLDLSLKGALLRLPSEGSALAAGEPCQLTIHLNGADAAIGMAGEIGHLEMDHAGIVCRSIDLESITHLRRLIEMNLGDASLLDRDLRALVSSAAR